MGLLSILKVVGSLATGPIGGIFTAGANFLGHRSKMTELNRKAEIEIKMAETISKVKMAEAMHTNNSQIDLAVVNQRGFMDELLGITVFSPLIWMLLLAPIIALTELYLSGSTGLNLGQIVPGMGAQGLPGYAGAIFDIYAVAFKQIGELPEEYWWGAGLTFIHFLGMRGFVTQIVAAVGNKSLISFGKSK